MNGTSSVSFVSTTNTYERCFIADYGAFVYLINVGSFEDTSSEFTQGAAILGGAIYCESCTMILTSTKFQTLRAQNGGSILLSNAASMTLTTASIVDSYAVS